VLGEPGVGVDGGGVGAAGADLEVQVWSGGSAGGADVGDVLAGPHLVADRDVDAVVPHVRVGGGDFLAGDGVFDDDEVPVAGGWAGDGNHAVCDSEDWGAVRGGVVRAGV